VPADKDVLPIPADQDFIYLPIRPMAAPRAAVDRKGLHKKFAVVPRPPGTVAPKAPNVSKGAVPAAQRSRPIGHQLTLSKPTASL
jgi:hypothetical protein